MKSLARLLSVLVLVGALATGCAMEHTRGADTGRPDAAWSDPDGSSVIHTCVGSLPAGWACDFTEPCHAYSDYWMGRCGQETWACVDGRIEYTDRTFACAFDGGTDAGPADWCEGYVAPPAATTDDCRADSDCASHGGTCWVPGDTAGLHGGGACPMDCATDPDCAPGDVCEQFNGTFCSVCIPACTPTSCGTWEACGGDGHCHPARCDTDGYVCPPGSHCEAPGDTVFDTHRCTIADCASDADCGCGACVDGACALGPGRCDLPRP